MSVFQELITRLILDPAKYVAGANIVKGASHEATLAIDEMVLHAKEGGAKIGEAFRFGELVAPLAAVASAVGIVELGKHAEETAIDFDKLERRIVGVTHSAERAKQVMEFGEKQSGLFGIASPEELDAVAGQLETLKLRTEEYLPVLEKLAILSPQGASGMAEFAEAFALIEQGQGGRAIRELERVGITIPILEKHGLRFSGIDDQTGVRTLVTPPKQALKGIEAAINEVGGPVLAAYANGPEADLRRFENAADQAYRVAGNAILHDLVPAAESGEKAIEDLTKTGRIQHMTESFLELFGIKSDSLEDGLKRVGEWITEIPDKLREGKRLFMEWLPVLADIAEMAAALKVAFTVAGWVEAAVAGYRSVGLAAAAAAGAEEAADVASGVGIGTAIAAGAAGVAAYEGLKATIDSVTDSVNKLGEAHTKSAAAAEIGAKKVVAINQVLDVEMQIGEVKRHIAADKRYGPAFDRDLARNNAELARLEKLLAADWEIEKKTEVTPEKDPSKNPSTNTPEPLSPQNQLLQQIVTNTREMAHDLRRYALNGGDLGQLGVAAIDQRSQHHGGGTKGRLVAAIADFVNEQGSRSVAGMMRNGTIGRS